MRLAEEPAVAPSFDAGPAGGYTFLVPEGFEDGVLSLLGRELIMRAVALGSPSD